MIVYLLVLTFSLIGVCVFDISGRAAYSYKQKKDFYYFVSVIIILVVALRYRLGVDGLDYEDETYPVIPPFSKFFSDEISIAEPLWLLFCSGLKEISESFLLYQIIYSLFLNIVIFSFAFKYSKFPFIFICVYLSLNCFYLNCELLRQGFSIAIFLIIEKYIRKGQLLKYYLGSIIALFFHYSGFILFFVPLLKSTCLCRKNLLKVTLISIIMAPLFKYLSRGDLYWLGTYFGDKFSIYSGRSEQILINSFILLKIVIPFVLLYFAAKSKRKRTSFDMYILVFVFFNNMCPFFSVANRFASYFEIFYMIEASTYIGEKCRRVAKLNIKPIYFIIICLLWTLNYYSWFGIKTFDGKHRQIVAIYPYSSILYPEKDHARESSGWASFK